MTPGSLLGLGPGAGQPELTAPVALGMQASRLPRDPLPGPSLLYSLPFKPQFSVLIWRRAQLPPSYF